jgi:hypothetical protein
VPAAPAASCAKCSNAHECRHREVTGTPGIPARNDFNGFLRALLGDRAFLSPSSALLLADLTPASRRQDHTTSPSASAPFVNPRCPRPPHPAPYVRDDCETPLFGSGTARVVEMIWVNREAEYFSKWGWTAKSPNSLSGQISTLAGTEPTGRRNDESGDRHRFGSTISNMRGSDAATRPSLLPSTCLNRNRLARAAPSPETVRADIARRPGCSVQKQASAFSN